MEVKELLSLYIEDLNFSVVEKGTRINNYRKKEIAVLAFNMLGAIVTVPSESGSNKAYTITFKFDLAKDYVADNCECIAFGNFGECKHCAAAAIYLINHWSQPGKILQPVAKKETTNRAPEKKEASRGKIILPFNSISANDILMLTNRYGQWQDYFGHSGCTLIKTIGSNHFFQVVTASREIFSAEINFILPNQLEFTCTCGKAKLSLLCSHISSALIFLSKTYGPYYFNKFKDFSKEKNELLAEYGLSLADKEANDFEFDFDNEGNIFIKKFPSYLVKVKDEKSLSALARQMIYSAEKPTIARPELPPGKFIDFDLGYLFNFSSKQHFHFLLQPLTISEKSSKRSFGKIVLSKKQNLAWLKSLPDEQFILFEQLSDDAIKNHLIFKGFVNLTNYSAWQQQLDDKAVDVIREYYHSILKQLWPFLAEQENLFMLPAEKTFTPKNLQPIEVAIGDPEVSFKVTRDEKFVTVQLLFTINGESLSVTNGAALRYIFIMHNGKYHLLHNYAHVKLLQQFESGMLKFPVNHLFDVLRKVIMPLQQIYPVEIDAALRFESRKADAVPHVMVSEYLNQFLMLMPHFDYEGHTVEYDDEPGISIQNDEGFFVIERDKNAEKNFYERLRYLHPSFTRQLQNPFYYVPFSEVMKGNWFLHAIRQLQDENITVKGIQHLKKFRYNTARPKWQMKTGSGVDWFELQINVSFGEQQVPLRDIQKAIRSGQKIIVLGDGTFGVLPEEWLKQYSMLMKMGDEDKGTLRVNKLHFTLIDELHELIDEEAVLHELAEKKHRLQIIENVNHKPVSKKIQAKLRPYQLSGFKWMQVLDELNWGGCLADDMGLGKTLQAICFLQYIKEKNKGATSLVVCPTSLIYNWENELQKFSPSLKYHIYYGSNRSFSDEHLENYDIIITSYGTMRNDIKELKEHKFEYILLDESQQIKNPDAQVTKAVVLLQSKNRLILSGTPVQNNTFDLYAQMNFLNPGFLGNREFFKANFATPIDKSGDSETAAQLRRLIYPFIMRRTKEQVATDLPDKTETILWCEMGKEQRAVYDEYKNYYRHKLLDKIEESGMGNAAMYILEGLMRLRQICDSPVLVKDEEVTTTASIKLEELLREVLENTGNHKLLIFSQFTEMLALVKDIFIKNKIAHLYLDGSTPAGKRKEIVDQFQNEENIKSFLISLKAGGVGLNLTSADYVYLIDPWWNPAVEDQAIDRTHRIGQTQKVFAYKMICKDTVEEKILQLQQKKKALSKELISEEKSFIKKLTKDDVAFLFS